MIWHNSGYNSKQAFVIGTWSQTIWEQVFISTLAIDQLPVPLFIGHHEDVLEPGVSLLARTCHSEAGTFQENERFEVTTSVNFSVTFSLFGHPSLTFFSLNVKFKMIFSDECCMHLSLTFSYCSEGKLFYLWTARRPASSPAH